MCAMSSGRRICIRTMCIIFRSFSCTLRTSHTFTERSCAHVRLALGPVSHHIIYFILLLYACGLCPCARWTSPEHTIVINTCVFYRVVFVRYNVFTFAMRPNCHNVKQFPDLNSNPRSPCTCLICKSNRPPAAPRYYHGNTTDGRPTTD